MAGQSRTLKLSILADVDQLNKSLKAANNDVENSSSKIGDFGRKAGLAFAAAGVAAAAYAIKIGIDGVKAAIADEAAQTKLATALENTTGATDAQIKAIEQQILKTSLLTGKTDDELRPSLQRLVQSTKNIEEAQKLQALALDISAGGTVSLEAASNALAKAHDGNLGALKKLGGGVADSIIKSKDFESATAALALTFKDQASKQAETFEVRIARLKIAFDESVETIGFALLPILQKFLDFIITYILPVVQRFSDAMSSKSPGGLGTRIQETVAVVQSYATPIFEGLVKLFNKVKDAITDNKDAFQSFFEVVKVIAPIIGKVIGAALSVIGDIAGVVIDLFAKVLAVIQPILNFAIDSVNAIIRGLNLIKPGADIPSVKGITSTPGTYSSISGVLGSTTPTITAPKAPKIVVPSSSAGVSTAASSASAAGIAITGQSDYSASVSMGKNLLPAFNVTVNQGIVGDPESAARAVVDVVNRSFFRGTGGATAFVTV